MGNEIDFICKHCGHNKGIKKENALMIYSECTSCGDPTLIESENKVPYQPIYTPTCPTCQSTNVSKIGTLERTASVVGLGLLSKKINKSFKCKSCGYTW